MCVFSPAAGRSYRQACEQEEFGTYGYYWSSTPHENFSDEAIRMYFREEGKLEPQDNYVRADAYSVRCVAE